MLAELCFLNWERMEGIFLLPRLPRRRFAVCSVEWFMQDCKNLAVWKRAHPLALAVYVASKDLPQSESFGLVMHLRRTVVGIAARIADGAGRTTSAEFAGELRKSMAAGFELDSLLLVSKDLEFLPEARYDELSAELAEVRKMLSGLLKQVGQAS
jgi:four helix bundle protein